MREGDSVVFVEVKYRGRTARARGAESVSGGQRRRLEGAASAWLERHGLAPLRFDVVAIDDGGRGLRLAHLRGGFSATGRSGI